MAIEDENKLKLSRRVASVWVVISMAVVVLIGVVGFSFMKSGIVPSGTKAELPTGRKVLTPKSRTSSRLIVTACKNLYFNY